MATKMPRLNVVLEPPVYFTIAQILALSSLIMRCRSTSAIYAAATLR